MQSPVRAVRVVFWSVGAAGKFHWVSTGQRSHGGSNGHTRALRPAFDLTRRNSHYSPNSARGGSAVQTRAAWPWNDDDLVQALELPNAQQV